MNPKRNFFFAVACLLFLFGAVARAQTNGATNLSGLATQIDAHIGQAKFSGAIWGIKVVSLDTGRTLYEHHPDRLMSPASNSKLYTGALALTHFGGDYHIATPIFATAPVDGSGTLNGDLIISGRGDPSWNSRRLTNFSDIFEPFVTEIAKAGIKQITGDIVGDGTYFHGPPTGSSWTIDDFDGGEGAIISALTLDDNMAQARVSPSASPGEPGAINILQPGAGLVISNRVVTSTANSSAHVEVYHPIDSSVFYLIGHLPLHGESQTEDIPVLDPAKWFAAALKIALEKHGIRVGGEAHSVAWPETPAWDSARLTKIGEVLSPPMREVIRGFMKPSQNLECDMMLADAGEAVRSPNENPDRSSEDAGLAALREFLSSANIPGEEVRFDEGSGLSRNNLTTADATVRLLQHMAKSPEAQDFKDSLPIAGQDGTLRRRFANTPAAGNVHAKTGTLRWAQALSGYATSTSGEHLAFSVMINRFVAPPGRSGHDEIGPVVLMLVNYAGHSTERADYSPYGSLITKSFASAPFPHPARADGHTYHDVLYSAAEHYSDSTVAIFIPKNFRATDKVNFLVHFHGWRHTVATTLDEYKLIEQFAGSGLNAILIVPQGPYDSPDSFGGKLEDTNGFSNFMTEAVNTVRVSGLIANTNFEIGDIILSGHSGGYHVMAAILDHGGMSQKIREVWLFDALYGNTDNFVAWQKNQNGRLLNIYTDHGGTKDETEKLMASFKSAGVPFYAAEDVAATPDNLRASKLVFLHTDMEHNDVPMKRSTFEEFLKTSCFAIE